MEYAAQIWDPYTKDNIQLLEAVQRRAARFVCNKYSRHESVTSMLQDLDWPLLEQRQAESRLCSTGQVLEKVQDAKYLGVTVSDDLEWTKYISNAITTKTNSKLSFLRYNLKGCPEN